MSTGSLSYLPSIRKVVCALLLLSASFLSISDGSILVSAQTFNSTALKSRVINATKSLNADALLIDPNITTYQSKAFLQLSRQVGVDGFTDAKLAQYYALYCIYFATNAVPNEITDNDIRFKYIKMPEWTESTNWKNETTVDPCGNSVIDLADNTTLDSILVSLSFVRTEGWKGVTCNDQGRVISLELYENFLTGVWPEEVVLLASDGRFSTGAGALEFIDLYDNKFLSNGDDSSWMSHLGSNMSKS